MRLNLFILSGFLFLLLNAQSQTIIKGHVESNKKEIIPGVNIILQDSYDGTTTDLDGNFEFTTDETGAFILIASFIGYVEFSDTLDLQGETIELNIILKEAFNELNAVLITAGAFEASDEKKSVVFSSLDIVTTAGADGDIYGALETLPGVTSVGNDDGLYVRGGTGYETVTIIDGVPVQNPYYSTLPDIPSRGRFGPFLFKGTVFSTGGYSAEYGQALSSAVILNTFDMPEQSTSAISLSPIFASAFHTHKFKNTAIGAGINYTNLSFYDLLFKPRTYNNIESVEALSGNIFLRQKTSKNGILRLYGQFEGSGLGVSYPDIDSTEENIYDDVYLINRYNYFNLSYREIIAKKWTINVGGSLSFNKDSVTVGGTNFSSGNDAFNGKLSIANQINEKIRLRFGAETQSIGSIQYSGTFTYDAKQAYTGLFAESDIFITNDLAGRIGVRSEYDQGLDKYNLAPRISLAYKVGESGQISVAYGDFYQSPQAQYLYVGDNSLLTYEKATHYIANYQFITNDRTFRIEAYYKKYDDLISYSSITNQPGDIFNLNNKGYGYAQGFDIFYRDKKTIKNGDFWVSYSYIDSKRKFSYYPEEAQPDFVTNHILSVIYKQYFSKIRTQFGASYRFNAGFPYYDPNETGFMTQTSPIYNDISINASFLTQIAGNFTVIFASFNNVFGFDQIYGYQFSYQDPGVVFTDMPPLKQTVFIGMFISIVNQSKMDSKGLNF
ncbi:MAG: TonB-dependent receptor [Bacteroidetes bacterium]|nr:TonB-dependent receptor [Bacteroidota bacterium]